jgi:hypothetical protein
MLQGLKITETVQTVQHVLALLNVSSHTYYLTGSRFFGNSTRTSDWDFFTIEYSREELVRLGFKSISSEVMTDLGYDRSQFSSIYELQLLDGTIQVQLIANIQAKIAIQSLIKSSYLETFNSMTKQARKDLWSLLLISYNQGSQY